MQEQLVRKKNSQITVITMFTVLLHTMTKMCADAHVSSSAGQVLMLTIRYVLVRHGIEIFFCKAKVNNMNDVVTTS